MIHSIAAPGRPISDDTTISEEYFNRFMEWAHQLGFETINTAQLVDFLENNAAIPPRSMILIVDDRKRAEFFVKYFAPYQKKFGWTVVNAWISHPDTPAYLWKENEGLAPGGLVDFQAHGVIHNTPIEPDSSDAFIHTEIFGPLDAIQQHFGKRPIAYIWPRGLFTPKAVQVARQAGYQAGFTTLPRGPLMFNWIPLGKEEQLAGDPLLVLPRYWDTNIIKELDAALEASTAAQKFASASQESEKAYLQTYCP
jgi:peptidoglycan/xylan/chitin deacetylase (PgdA/CDA1 family)